MEYFQKLQDVVLPEKLKILNKVKKGDKDPLKIKSLESEIYKIKTREEEIDYYAKTQRLIDEYFTLINEVSSDTSDRKTEIIKQYYNIIDMKNIPKIYSMDLSNETECKNCGYDVNYEEIEGLVCEGCGLVLAPNITSETGYKEMQETEFIKKIDYKRVDYFKQWLNQIQGKEHVEIPQNIIDSLILEIKKERIKNIANINISQTKRLLKKLGYSKYYEHIPYIINMINKVSPLCIPNCIENKLILMFEEIQLPWELSKTDERKNFFSYPYILHKFCQLLGLKEYLHYFPLLKSREKLHKQDIIWKKIVEYINNHSCRNYMINDIDWVFIPSL
jgi:hypothetical protein